MSLNKTKVLSCGLYILGGLLLNSCGLISNNEIDIPHEVDNYSYQDGYNERIKIKTDIKSVEDKHEVNVY